MAIRNRTLIFIQYRNEKKSFKKTNLIKKNVDASKIKLLGMNPETDVDLEEGKTNKLTLPPSWLSIIDDINYDISRIKSKMKELNEYHKNHLLPTIDDKIEDEQTIEILTEHITKLFQQAQTKILRIGAEGVNKQEESIKKNVQSTLAKQLQELSLEFRKSQKDYLQKLKGRQQRGKGFSIQEDVTQDDTKFDVSFTPEQQKILEESNVNVEQREKEVIQIARSINELASIFKDLSILVIEQGTILDRIDFNLEQVEHNTEETVVELGQAQKYQKGYRNKLCMLLLCICILVMVVVILVKIFAFHR